MRDEGNFHYGRGMKIVRQERDLLILTGGMRPKGEGLREILNRPVFGTHE